MKTDIATIDDLKYFLDKYTLDPVFLNYGRYVGKNSFYDYDPEYRKTNPSLYYLHLRFLEISITTKLEINKENYIIARKLISNHLKTDKFKKAFLDEFNVVKIETTVFYTDEALKKINSVDRWWGSYHNDISIPINCIAENMDLLKDLYKAERTKQENNKNAAYHRIKIEFDKIHFTPEDSNELHDFLKVNYEGKTKASISTCIYQAKEVTKNAEKYNTYKEYTFKSGRKIKYNPEILYSFLYISVDPVSNKPF